MSGTDRLVVHNSEIGKLIADDYTVEDIGRIRDLLNAHGTLEIPQLPNGLYAASGASGGDADLTGYHNTWVRDTMMIALSDLHTGERERGIRTVRAVLDFYKKHRHRFVDIIEGRADPDDPMNRPHIRFDGNTLTELPEKWAHAQNDALGYFLQGVGKAADSFGGKPALELTEDDLEVLMLFPRYFRAIRYWEDADSGHWEEARKVETSSIGTAESGLTQLLTHVTAFHDRVGNAPVWEDHFDDMVVDLLVPGSNALKRILPHESVGNADPSLDRDVDGAQTFLIWPSFALQPPEWPEMLERITTRLGGDYGIKRYIGDSYWCADYRQLLSAEERCADFSDDMSGRDAMLKPGTEAQWCIFDPVVSIAFGHLYRTTGEAEYRDRQVHHLNRALGQITGEGMNVAPWQCPEMYYLEDSSKGEYVPNDNTPLRWTQANLQAALHSMEFTIRYEKDFSRLHDLI